MNKFKELQNRHLELLEKLKANQSSTEFIQDVEAYIEEVKTAGKDISSSHERNQLRANLRFWGAFIFEQKKVFPDVTLWPSTKKDLLAKWRYSKTFQLAGGILGGLIFLGLLCLIGYLTLVNGASQQNDTTAQWEATKQEATIQAGLTQMAAVQYLTRDAVATNTVPPTNTPVIAEGTVTLSQTVNPATATVGAAVPGTGQKPKRFIPDVTYSASGCGDQEREIAIAWRDFTGGTSLSLGSSNIKNAVAYLSLLGTGNTETPAAVVPNGDFTILKLPDPGSDRSYLLQIKHPVFLFEPIIVQFTSDCAYDHVSVTYGGYSDLVDGSTWDVDLVLIDWGPDSLDRIYSWVALLAIRQGQDGIYMYNKSQIPDKAFLINGVNCVSRPFIVSRTSNGKYQEAVLSLYVAGPLCSK